MESNYFGEPNMGNERGGGSSSSSSRKGKKNDKPKQPQRGLGVAQLEKIRLHGQMTSGYHAAPFPSSFNNADPRVQTPYSSPPSSSSFCYSSSSSSSYSTSYGFHPNIVMGLPDYERTNIGYGDSQPTHTARWDQYPNANLDAQSSAQPSITRPFLNLYDSQPIDNKKQRNGSLGSSSKNSESSDTQELDLELRLSL